VASAGVHQNKTCATANALRRSSTWSTVGHAGTSAWVARAACLASAAVHLTIAYAMASVRSWLTAGCTADAVTTHVPEPWRAKRVSASAWPVSSTAAAVVLIRKQIQTIAVAAGIAVQPATSAQPESAAVERPTRVARQAPRLVAPPAWVAPAWLPVRRGQPEASPVQVMAEAQALRAPPAVGSLSGRLTARGSSRSPRRAERTWSRSRSATILASPIR
jgi:hypothetical protein